MPGAGSIRGSLGMGVCISGLHHSYGAAIVPIHRFENGPETFVWSCKNQLLGDRVNL